MCYSYSSYCHWGALPLPLPVPSAVVPQMYPQGLARPQTLVRFPNGGWSRGLGSMNFAPCSVQETLLGERKLGMRVGLAPRAKQETLCFYRCATTPNFDQDQQWAHCLEPRKVKGTVPNLWVAQDPLHPPNSSPDYQQIPHTWDSRPSPLSPSTTPLRCSEGEFWEGIASFCR